MDPQEAAKLVDENTIGCVAILGSTYTGHYEDAKTLNDLLEPINKKNGWNIPIHIGKCRVMRAAFCKSGTINSHTMRILFQ